MKTIFSMEKRGLSPVIASVLLIIIVVILASIVFLWARGFVKEGVAKFGKPADRACGEVKFEVGIYGNQMEVNNQGDIPLYGFDFKKLGRGEVIVTEYVASTGTNTVGSGDSVSLEVTGTSFSQGDNILVVPIILGETDSGRVAYTCDDTYGISATVV